MDVLFKTVFHSSCVWHSLFAVATEFIGGYCNKLDEVFLCVCLLCVIALSPPLPLLVSS